MNLTNKAGLKASLETMLITFQGNQGVNFITHIIYKLVSELQLICLILRASFDNASFPKDPITKFVDELTLILSYRKIDDSVIDTPAKFIAPLLVFVLVLVALLLANLFYYEKNKKKFAFKHLVKELCEFHLHIIFLLCLQSGLTIIKTDMDNGSITNISPILANVLIILSFLLAMFRAIHTQEYLNFQYYFVSKDAKIELLNVCYKTIDVYLAIFITKTEISSWSRISIAFIYLLEKSRRLFKLPYLNIFGFKILLISTSIQYSCLFGSFIINAGDLSPNFAPYTIAILSIIIIKIIQSLLKHQLVHYCQLPIQRINSKEQLHKKLYAFRALIQEDIVCNVTKDKLKPSELLYRGILVDHSKDCSSCSCYCRLILSDTQQADNQSLNGYQIYNITSVHIMREMLNEGLKKFPKSDAIRLTLAHSFYAEGDSLEKALLLAANCKAMSRKNNVKRAADILLQRVEEKYEESIKSSTLSSLNIKHIYEYYQLRSNLKELIKVNTKSYIAFWETFIQAEPNVRELIEISKKMDREAKKVEQAWNQMMVQRQKGAGLEYILYGQYLNIVRNAPFSSDEVVKKYIAFGVDRHHDEGLNLEHIFSSNVFTLFVSMESEARGDIILCSQEEIFGYNLLTFKDKNLKMLVPSCFRELLSYEYILQINHDHNQDISKEIRTLFIQKRDGSIAQAQVCQSSVQYIEGKALCVLFMKEIHTQHDYLIVSSDGTIHSATSGWLQSMGLDENRGLSAKFHQLCSKGKQILEAIFDEKDEETLSSLKEPVTEMSSPLKPTAKNPMRNYDIRSHLENSGVIARLSGVRGEGMVYLITIFPTNLENFTVLKLEKASSIMLREKSLTYSQFTREKYTEDATLKIEQNVSGIVTGVGTGTIRENTNMLTQQVYPDGDKDRVLIRSDEESFENPILRRGEHSSSNLEIKRAREDLKIREESIPSSAISSRNFHAKLEKAIYYVGEFKEVTLLKYFMVAHILLSIVLYLTFLLYLVRKLENIPKIADVSTSNFNRHYNLWVWGYWDIYLTKYQLRGFINDRFEMDPETFYNYTVSAYKSVGEELIHSSREIYQAIDLFEDDLQDRFFAPIRVWMPNETSPRFMDIFTFDGLVGNAMLRLYLYSEKLITEGNPDDPDYTFVEQNVMDDQLIVEEDIYHLIREDITLKLERVEDFNLGLNFVIIGFSCVIFGLLVYQTLRFFKKRNTFVDVFMRIRNDDVEKELLVIRQFYDQLCAAECTQKLLTLTGKTKGKLHSKEDKSKKAKIANTTNLNYKNYQHLLKVFLFMSMLGGLCMILYVDFRNKKKNIESAVSDAIETNLLFNQFGIAFSTLYEYFQGNSALTMRNKPYSDEWQRAYDEISNSASFFNSLRETDDKEFLRELDEVLKQDLCTLMYDYSGCFGPIAIARNGLLSINSLMLKGASVLKVSYDSSNKTTEAVQELINLDTLIDMEWSYWLYQPPGFQQLEAILKKQVMNNVESSITNSKALIITCTSCFFIFIWVFLQPLWNGILSEKILLRKMIRLIPINIIKKNSYIKHYLILTSQELLKNMRNLF